jgi:transposase
MKEGYTTYIREGFYCSVRDAATLRNVAVSTIRTWIANKKNPLPTVQIGGTKAINAADLEQYAPEPQGRRWK